MKKKHSKTGDDSRYHGTVLGKDVEEQSITIVGGPVTNLRDWGLRLKSTRNTSHVDTSEVATPATSGISSAPDSPINEEDDDFL